MTDIPVLLRAAGVGVLLDVHRSGAAAGPALGCRPRGSGRGRPPAPGRGPATRGRAEQPRRAVAADAGPWRGGRLVRVPRALRAPGRCPRLPPTAPGGGGRAGPGRARQPAADLPGGGRTTRAWRSTASCGWSRRGCCECGTPSPTPPMAATRSTAWSCCSRCPRWPTSCSTSPASGAVSAARSASRSTTARGCAPRAAAGPDTTPRCSWWRERPGSASATVRSGACTSPGAGTRCTSRTGSRRAPGLVARPSSEAASCCSPERSACEPGRATRRRGSWAPGPTPASTLRPHGCTGGSGPGRTILGVLARSC